MSLEINSANQILVNLLELKLEDDDHGKVMFSILQILVRWVWIGIYGVATIIYVHWQQVFLI